MTDKRSCGSAYGMFRATPGMNGIAVGAGMAAAFALLLALFPVAAQAQSARSDPPAASQAAADETENLTAYVFKSATCPHCNAQRPFLDALAEQNEPFETR